MAGTTDVLPVAAICQYAMHSATAHRAFAPAAACFNLAYYPFTESTYCMCTAVGTQTTADLAHTASDAALWALIAASALCAGAVIGTMELGASAAMLRADQLFLKVAKRRSSRWVGESPSWRAARWQLRQPLWRCLAGCASPALSTASHRQHANQAAPSRLPCRSSSSRGGGSRRDSSFSDMAQLGIQGLPHKSLSPAVMLHARG